MARSWRPVSVFCRKIHKPTLRALAYLHEDAGEGHNWNSGAWSNKGTAQELPIIFRNTLYSIDRRGGTLGIEWEIGAHRLQLGGWYEQNTSSASRPDAMTRREIMLRRSVSERRIAAAMPACDE